MTEVVLTRISKRYGHHAVVHDVDLHIADTEFVVLVGPSGCGKSTTLRMIAGLEDISSGELRIGTRLVNDLPPRDRDVAMVFQNYALYQHMTVYDNLAFGLRNRKVAEADIRREVDQATQILGLEGLLDRKPFQLSGGQQQRVALGRCIVRHPKVFLFDEPLSNLDAKLRAHMRIELKRLRERVATTSIYVTHDQVEAMTLGDRVVVMKDGRVQQIGTPLEIYNSPRSMFVAGFMGAPAMNFVHADLVREGDRVTARAGELAVCVPPEKVRILERHDRTRVVLGLRPENIRMGEPAAAGAAAFTTPVIVTEQLGSELLAGFRIGETIMMASRIHPETRIEIGQVTRFWVEPASMHIFDAETEEAVR